MLEGHYDFIWIEGELSNLARPGSGHWYFTLKDDRAQVRCAMFRNRNQRVKDAPRNGQQVLLRAKVSLYEGRGEFPAHRPSISRTPGPAPCSGLSRNSRPSSRRRACLTQNVNRLCPTSRTASPSSVHPAARPSAISSASSKDAFRPLNWRCCLFPSRAATQRLRLSRPWNSPIAVGISTLYSCPAAEVRQRISPLLTTRAWRAQ